MKIVGHRVVGGVDSEINEYPWMALLRLKSQANQDFFCGGTLVSSKWVITAAHCIFSSVSTSRYQKSWLKWNLIKFLLVGTLEVRLGEHKRSVTSESTITKDYNVDYILKHPKYDNPRQNSNDIALLRLAEEADISVHTPACLPTLNQDFTGQNSLLTG